MGDFRLFEDEEKKLKDFQLKHSEYGIHKEDSGAIGGNISVEFTLTSIGMLIYAKCSTCRKKKCLRELS